MPLAADSKAELERVAAETNEPHKLAFAEAMLRADGDLALVITDFMMPFLYDVGFMAAAAMPSMGQMVLKLAAMEAVETGLKAGMTARENRQKES